MMSVWPKGKEVDMIENLSYECTITTPEDTMAPWPGRLPGPVEGLLYHKGLYNEEPMEEYLNDYFADFDGIQKMVVLSAVDVESGVYTPFDESVGIENLGRVTRASTSIPFAFEPTNFNGRWYMDGGTVWNINIKDAIDKCLTIVDDQEHVVLDAVITEFLDLEELEETGKAYNNFKRKRDIGKYYKTMNDITEAMRARPHVNYRHFFQPSESLGGARTELDFRNVTTWKFQEVGRSDAYAALNGGERPAKSEETAALEHTFTNMVAANYNSALASLEKLTSYFLQ